MVDAAEVKRKSMSGAFDSRGPEEADASNTRRRVEQQTTSKSTEQNIGKHDYQKSSAVFTSPDDSEFGGLDSKADPKHRAARSKFIERKFKRRPENESLRGKTTFNPHTVIEFLTGRYRSVSREMRSGFDVHFYEPEENVCPEDERDVDFESMMREALEDFAREGRRVGDGDPPT